MNIELLAIGKTKSDYLRTGIDEYLKRLRRYVPYKITELPDVKGAGKLPHDEQKAAEGNLLLDYFTPADFVMLLDQRGDQFTSPQFATRLQAIMASGKKRLLLVIGGPYGFSKAVYDRADAMLSLSKMTFNHEMVRLFATEQVYRAMTILRGEPYHH